MHRNNYENTDWFCPEGEEEPRWRLSPPARPYGIIPGQEEVEKREPVSLPCRTPSAWAGRPRRQKVGGRGTGRFALCLALILVLAGTSLILWPEESGRPVPGGSWSGWDFKEDWEQWEYQRDWMQELKKTSIRRAPHGDGTVLELAQAGGELLSARDVYQRVSPAVVVVQSTLEGGTSLGTGIVMSSDGYIITNAHVIAGASEVQVTFSDNREEEALLVGYDGESDLAVLKIDGEDLPVAEFGDSAALQVGDAAYAIGNPLGEELRGTMTDGIISAIDRTVAMDGGDMTLVQTTAALNSGNSGGALVNAYGQVVGITNMKMMSDWETIEGLGFAIPTASAKTVIDQLIARGAFLGRPALGVTVVTRLAGEDTPAGAYISWVEPRSDAYRQGVRAGHIITGANGTVVRCVEELETAKEGLQVGDTIDLEIWTARGTRSIQVELMDRSQFEN